MTGLLTRGIIFIHFTLAITYATLAFSKELQVGIGDNAYHVKKLLGMPNETDESELIYYNHKGNYIRFHLDSRRDCVNSFFMRKGSTKEEMEKREEMLAKLIEKGQIPSDEELKSRLKSKLAHERVTEREYKKLRRENKRLSKEYYTLKGLLKDKNQEFSPVEKAHDLDRRMGKFIVEYKAMKDRSVRKVSQDCFLDRFDVFLKRKYDSMSVGDMITVQGRWKNVEDKEGTAKKGVELEQRMFMTIFLVDQIKE